MKFHLKDFIAEVDIVSASTDKVSLRVHTTAPQAADVGFYFYSTLKKEDNDSLFNVIKSFEYPRLLRFSGKLQVTLNLDKEYFPIQVAIQKVQGHRLYSLIHNLDLNDIKAYELKKD